MSLLDEKEQFAKELADRHYRTEITTVSIHRLTAGEEKEAQPDEPIKLLEVNEEAIPSPSELLPLYFAPRPASGIPYPSIIIEVTPDEFQQIEKGHLRLPNNWEIGTQLPPPAGEPV